MITISNYDRDRAAAYIDAYAETLAAAARSSAKAANRRRPDGKTSDRNARK